MSREVVIRNVCNRCESPITENQTLCECGTPTHYMSFEDRNKFEVERYRQMQQSA